MCFRKIKLNGEKYNLAQAQAIFDKMSKEIDTLAFENNALKSDLEESKNTRQRRENSTKKRKRKLLLRISKSELSKSNSQTFRSVARMASL